MPFLAGDVLCVEYPLHRAREARPGKRARKTDADTDADRDRDAGAAAPVIGSIHPGAIGRNTEAPEDGLGQTARARGNSKEGQAALPLARGIVLRIKTPRHIGSGWYVVVMVSIVGELPSRRRGRSHTGTGIAGAPAYQYIIEMCDHPVYHVHFVRKDHGILRR